MTTSAAKALSWEAMNVTEPRLDQPEIDLAKAEYRWARWRTPSASTQMAGRFWSIASVGVLAWLFWTWPELRTPQGILVGVWSFGLGGALLTWIGNR